MTPSLTRQVCGVSGAGQLGLGPQRLAAGSVKQAGVHRDRAMSSAVEIPFQSILSSTAVSPAPILTLA